MSIMFGFDVIAKAIIGVNDTVAYGTRVAVADWKKYSAEEDAKRQAYLDAKAEKEERGAKYRAYHLDRVKRLRGDK